MRAASGSFAVAVAATLAAHAAAGAQSLPSGYRVWLPDQSQDLTLAQEQLPSPFEAVIDRRAETTEEGRWLRIAESLYPPRDSVVPTSRCPQALAVDNLWWSDCSVEPRRATPVPIALTASAVRFYLDRIEAFRNGDFRGWISHGVPPRRASLAYEASGEWQDDFVIGDERFSDVYVVTLRLDFDTWCGLLCGQSFRKKRVIVFSRAGDVLAVEGDGDRRFMVY